MVANTAPMNAAGTEGWNRSDIEFTNTSRGRLHRYGSSSASAWVATSNPRLYFLTPMACRRFAIRSA